MPARDGAYTVNGVVGRIDWSYFTAAALNGYRVTRTSKGETFLSGTCVMSNAFNLSRRPLTFVAPTKSGEWRWPILELQMQNGRVVARLGEYIRGSDVQIRTTGHSPH